MDWIINNYQQVFEIIGQIVVVASAIVALTPSTSDDAFIGKIVSIIEKFSVFSKRTK